MINKKGWSSVSRFFIENNIGKETFNKNEDNKIDKSDLSKINKLNTVIDEKDANIEFNLNLGNNQK